MFNKDRSYIVYKSLISECPKGLGQPISLVWRTDNRKPASKNWGWQKAMELSRRWLVYSITIKGKLATIQATSSLQCSKLRYFLHIQYRERKCVQSSREYCLSPAFSIGRPLTQGWALVGGLWWPVFQPETLLGRYRQDPSGSTCCVSSDQVPTTEGVQQRWQVPSSIPNPKRLSEHPNKFCQLTVPLSLFGMFPPDRKMCLVVRGWTCILEGALVCKLCKKQAQDKTWEGVPLMHLKRQSLEIFSSYVDCSEKYTPCEIWRGWSCTSGSVLGVDSWPEAWWICHVLQMVQVHSRIAWQLQQPLQTLLLACTKLRLSTTGDYVTMNSNCRFFSWNPSLTVCGQCQVIYQRSLQSHSRGDRCS